MAAYVSPRAGMRQTQNTQRYSMQPPPASYSTLAPAQPAPKHRYSMYDTSGRSSSSSSSNEEAAPQPQAPPGWLTSHDEQGRVYYVSLLTGKAQWTFPGANSAPLEKTELQKNRRETMPARAPAPTPARAPAPAPARAPAFRLVGAENLDEAPAENCGGSSTPVVDLSFLLGHDVSPLPGQTVPRSRISQPIIKATADLFDEEISPVESSGPSLDAINLYNSMNPSLIRASTNPVGYRPFSMVAGSTYQVQGSAPLPAPAAVAARVSTPPVLRNPVSPPRKVVPPPHMPSKRLSQFETVSSLQPRRPTSQYGTEISPPLPPRPVSRTETMTMNSPLPPRPNPRPQSIALPQSLQITAPVPQMAAPVPQMTAPVSQMAVPISSVPSVSPVSAISRSPFPNLRVDTAMEAPPVPIPAKTPVSEEATTPKTAVAARPLSTEVAMDAAPTDSAAIDVAEDIHSELDSYIRELELSSGGDTTGGGLQRSDSVATVVRSAEPEPEPELKTPETPKAAVVDMSSTVATSPNPELPVVMGLGLGLRRTNSFTADEPETLTVVAKELAAQKLAAAATATAESPELDSESPETPTATNTCGLQRWDSVVSVYPDSPVQASDLHRSDSVASVYPDSPVQASDLKRSDSVATIVGHPGAAVDLKRWDSVISVRPASPEEDDDDDEKVDSVPGLGRNGTVKRSGTVTRNSTVKRSGTVTRNGTVKRSGTVTRNGTVTRRQQPGMLGDGTVGATNLKHANSVRVANVFGQLRRTMTNATMLTTWEGDEDDDDDPTEYTDEYEEVNDYAAQSYQESTADLENWLRITGAS